MFDVDEEVRSRKDRDAKLPSGLGSTGGGGCVGIKMTRTKKERPSQGREAREEFQGTGRYE